MTNPKITKANNEWVKKLMGLQLRTLEADGITNGIFRFKNIKDFIQSLLSHQKQQIFKDLIKIADEFEYEDLRREVTIYFKGEDK